MASPLKFRLDSAAARGAKEVHLETTGTQVFFIHILGKAYCMLDQKYNVEFHVHIGKGHQGADFRLDRQLFKNYVHPLPDVILRAMPENSGIVIDPRADHKQICWVVGPPQKGGQGKLVKPANRTTGLNHRRQIQLRRDDEREATTSRGALEKPSEGTVQELKSPQEKILDFEDEIRLKIPSEPEAAKDFPESPHRRDKHDQEKGGGPRISWQSSNGKEAYLEATKNLKDSLRQMKLRKEETGVTISRVLSDRKVKFVDARDLPPRNRL